MESNRVKDIYVKTLAGKFALEKELIAFELRKYGIQSILTKPENLSVDTINKYLELKSRGMIYTHPFIYGYLITVNTTLLFFALPSGLSLPSILLGAIGFDSP